MLEEAEKYAASDNEQKVRRDIIFVATQTCQNVEAELEKLNSEESTLFTDEEKEEIKSVIQTIRDKVANTEESTESITQSCQELTKLVEGKLEGINPTM